MALEESRDREMLGEDRGRNTPGAGAGDDQRCPLALLGNIRVVMVRPKGSLNVGLVARVIKNMGLGGLVLVEPPDLNMEQAVRMASRATDVLREARVVGTLEEALGDTVFSVATSARSGGERGEPILPGQAGARMVKHAAKGPVALVLGPEDHGLSNEDLALCTVRGAIPSSPHYSSLNITHAAALFCYECRLAALGGPVAGFGREGSEMEPGTPHSPSRGARAGHLPVEPPAGGGARGGGHPVACHSEVDGFMGHLGGLLGRVGFLNPQNPDAILRKVRKFMNRSGATSHEVTIMRGMVRQIEWYLDQGDSGE